MLVQPDPASLSLPKLTKCLRSHFPLKTLAQQHWLAEVRLTERDLNEITSWLADPIKRDNISFSFLPNLCIYNNSVISRKLKSSGATSVRVLTCNIRLRAL
jgi:hypothetical protein